eukprot:s1908_g9.t1
MALFSLAQHAALSEAAAGLQEGEAILALLDDTYVVSAPEPPVRCTAPWRTRCGAMHAAGLKAKLAYGMLPVKSLPASLFSNRSVRSQSGRAPGFLVLGAPLGSDAFVQLELRRKRETQDQLITRLPAVGDLQCAWLLLLFCASLLASNAPTWRDGGFCARA